LGRFEPIDQAPGQIADVGSASVADVALFQANPQRAQRDVGSHGGLIG
jgi:hypothetical protein